MTAITEESTKHWPRVEQELQFLKEQGVFPLKDLRDGKEMTFDGYKKSLEDLENELFTISVCGVVKAGKSTFLNALLFGEDILPTFATPMTAKLTFIEYTTEPRNFFEVHFYSKEEFVALKSSLTETSLAQFNNRLKIVGERGATKIEWVGHAPIKVSDLSKLFEYVADPAAAVNREKNLGNYTPFVKEVHIYINNEAVKNVCVVDTPGLRDSNIINAEETKKWVNKSHAVVYLLQNKGATKGDVDFLLLDYPSTPDNRIFVINQIDKLNSPQQEVAAIKQYIKREVGTRRDYKEKNLFGPQEKIYGYSALGVLLDKMIEKGLSIEKYQEDYELIQEAKQEGCNFDEDQIEKKISSVFYQNQGAILKDSGKRLVLHVYAIAENNYQIEHVDLKCELEDLSKDVTTLNREVAQANEKVKNFNSVIDRTGEEMAEKVDELCRKYEKDIAEIIGTFVAAFKGYDSLKKMINEANTIQTKTIGLKTELSNKMKSFKNEMNKTAESIQNRVLRQAFLDAGMGCERATVRLKQLDTDFQVNVDEYTKAIYNCVPKNGFTYFIATKIGTGGDIVRTVDNMSADISKTIGEFFSQAKQDDYCKDFVNQLKCKAEDLGKLFEEKVKNSRMSKEERQKKLEAKKKQLNDMTAKLDALQERRRKFEREMDLL